MPLPAFEGLPEQNLGRGRISFERFFTGASSTNGLPPWGLIVIDLDRRHLQPADQLSPQPPGAGSAARSGSRGVYIGTPFT